MIGLKGKGARLLVGLALFMPAATHPHSNPLARVRSWMMQLQNTEKQADIEALAKSDYDMLVVEPGATVKGNGSFDMRAMVARLKRDRPDRIVLAYLDACQAESYRAYWKKSWKAPRAGQRGKPGFLLAADPDGWEGNYQVAYWDPRWQALIKAEVRRVMRAGFDGLYLDWILAYEEESVLAEAQRQGVSAAAGMLGLMRAIQEQARAINPRALIIQQNAVGLIRDQPGSLDLIDGVAFEDTWFRGVAGAAWEDPAGGDVSSKGEQALWDEKIQGYKAYLRAGKAVFTLDYCLNPHNAKAVQRDAQAFGFIPLVSRIALDRMASPVQKQGTRMFDLK